MYREVCDRSWLVLIDAQHETLSDDPVWMGDREPSAKVCSVKVNMSASVSKTYRIIYFRTLFEVAYII